MKQRVVVTGLGIVSALGSSIELAWTNILAGVSGAAPITAFDATGYPVTFSASTKDFDVSKYMNPKDAKRMDLFIQYGIGAAVDAINDAGLEITDANADRIGAMLGAGIGGLPGIEENCETLLKKGPNRISPFYVPRSIINMLPGQLSILTGFKGPSISAVTACASGTHSIGMAARMIAYGDADVMIAGGAEMATTPTGIGGFAAARALSNRNDEPTKASRPWDKDRNGFVLGDGAGVLILESYEHAVKRGARIYCELVGFGATSD
ncbi:MAG: beta-ketoacyl-ACP synthase II, partial [Wohlfahrtiimonas sp.]